jgi:2-polyprenyl-3-methyl-5-hydroxy-6-metoxy-1,4-benzoquinol methylase
MFELPAEHAAYLTRAAGADNFAVFSQYFGVLGGVEDKVLDCVRNGGGVAYSEFPRFHEVMAEDSGQAVGFTLFDMVLPMDPATVEKLEKGAMVMDVGCGRGKALMMMARRFPQSNFLGLDLSKEAITYARAQAAEYELPNVVFQERDLTDFDETAPEGTFDFITAFDAIHDQARPDRVLAGINRALKKDGTFLMVDINASSNPVNNTEHPMGPLLYTISCMHCMTVSLAQGGAGLGACWGRELATKMLKDAGFTSVKINELSHDIQNCYYVVHKK